MAFTELGLVLKFKAKVKGSLIDRQGSQVLLVSRKDLEALITFRPRLWAGDGLKCDWAKPTSRGVRVCDQVCQEGCPGAPTVSPRTASTFWQILPRSLIASLLSISVPLGTPSHVLTCQRSSNPHIHVDVPIREPPFPSRSFCQKHSRWRKGWG